MQSIKVSEGQTLLDVAIEHLGDASRWDEIADLNGMGLTDALPIGGVLLVPDAAIEKQGVVDLFKPSYQKPSSAEDQGLAEIFGEGLEYWAIEVDFVIS